MPFQNHYQRIELKTCFVSFFKKEKSCWMKWFKPKQYDSYLHLGIFSKIRLPLWLNLLRITKVILTIQRRKCKLVKYRKVVGLELKKRKTMREKINKELL